jgi:hypothetical protein
MPDVIYIAGHAVSAWLIILVGVALLVRIVRSLAAQKMELPTNPELSQSDARESKPMSEPVKWRD